MTQQTNESNSHSAAHGHGVPAPTDVVQAAEAARAAAGDTTVTWDRETTHCGWRPPLWR